MLATAAAARRRPRRVHRVGIYEPSPGKSGPGRYVEALLRELDPAEFDVTLFGNSSGPFRVRPSFVAIDGRQGSNGEWARRTSEETRHAAATRGATSGASKERPVVCLVPQAFRLWAGFARDASHLARTLLRHPIDLFHTQWAGCEEAPVAAKLAGVPKVLGTFHVDSTYDLDRVRSGTRHRLLEHLSNHCLHRAIAVSEATKRDWLRRTHLSSRRVVTIHNGIDPEHFQRRLAPADARRCLGFVDDGRLIIGGVGRLDSAKGFEYLVEAVAMLVGEFPTLSLILAGEGPLRARLTERAVALGICDRVRLLGFVDDVRIVYDAIDVFALSSLCEALPYALLEAMAHELPVVGTSVAGVPEVIVPDETGFLVSPRNAAALAAALRPLLASARLRHRMAGAGRDRVVQHFQERDSVRRTIEVYRELLGQTALRTRRT